LIRPKDRQRAADIIAALRRFDSKTHALPGIQAKNYRDALVAQILESIHRIEYVDRVKQRPISPNRANPSSELFDPLRAAILYQQSGDFDEACWLVFFFVHFGKNAKTGWRLARDVYGALGGKPWTWGRASANPAAFRAWLASRQVTLEGRDGIERSFGAHRRYQSLDAASNAGTGAAIATYVEWVGPKRSHQHLIDTAISAAAGDRRRTFNILYRSLATVKSFGRLARFDYLTMLGKMRLADIEPDSTYMVGSTGPSRGARLLFGDAHGPLTKKQLDAQLIQLSDSTDLGMQVLEDSLCNWQKRPEKFVPFRG
jgi:hypothetical protein